MTATPQFPAGTPLQYRNGNVIGYGFVINFAGRLQHSVAWPNGPALRYMDDELREKHIECSLLEPAAVSATTEASDDQPSGEGIDLGGAETTDPPAGQPDFDPQPTFIADPQATEARNIRDYLRTFPDASNQEVIAALHDQGVEVASNQVTRARKQLADGFQEGEQED